MPSSSKSQTTSNHDNILNSIDEKDEAKLREIVMVNWPMGPVKTEN